MDLYSGEVLPPLTIQAYVNATAYTNTTRFVVVVGKENFVA